MIKKGGMPLARLQLRLPTREGEVTNLNQWGKDLKPLVPQFPLAEPAGDLHSSHYNVFVPPSTRRVCPVI